MTELTDFSTRPPKKYSKKKCIEEVALIQEKLFELQNVFYADARFGLLIIFQGLDTAGKDGTIRHVMSCMNPSGVDVKSFKQPTPEEITHDFLWRVYPHIPGKGFIEVFNRSYYEDILVPSILNTLSKDELHHRCNLINTLENHLELNKIHVLKFFLHISKEEQQKRIKERLTHAHKKWKYDIADQEAADRWDEYMNVYELLINKCKGSEWHIIPADKRWFRNYKVGKIITAHLSSLHLRYPESQFIK